MRNLGYTGSPAATPVEIGKWLQQASQSKMNPNGAWDYFCQGLTGHSTTVCKANPFNGTSNIYSSGLGQLFSLKGLEGFARMGYAIAVAFSPAFGAPEIGVGSDVATGSLVTAVEDAGATANMAANTARGAGEIRAETGVASMTDPAALAEADTPSALRVLAENFKDTTDAIESVSTASHAIEPVLPVVPQAAAGSGLIATILENSRWRELSRHAGR